MKALILAAGFGTRLSPHTRVIPKPLFTLNDIPILEHAVKRLETCGCEQILINTHHLHEQIKMFVQSSNFKADIRILHEPQILDTGGAIANAKTYLDDTPFLVVNADIISSMDLKKLYQAHIHQNVLATLALHDCPQFNKIRVDEKGFIKGFTSGSDGLAFTGIQVLSPSIFEFFPNDKKFSSIDVYKQLCLLNQVKSWIPVKQERFFWSDIGTSEAYLKTSAQTLAALTFNLDFNQISQISITALSGDGSDRNWFRACFKDQTCIISGHGICMPGSDKRRELSAFIHIGQHLKTRQVNVPKIFNFDRLSGTVTLEDLGDCHLQTLVKETNDQTRVLDLYKGGIDHLIHFSQNGLKNFDLNWTCQTPSYSKGLIIEKECQYFMTAFVQGYLQHPVKPDGFMDEFNFIADNALKYGFTGLMHRDFQSRNIMIYKNQPFFIDFQSARKGPLQYDLASLLIDPYVNLNTRIQNDLLNYAMERLNLDTVQQEQFLTSYRFCCLTRNLQMLGAFGFLTREKNKKGFEQYIPQAVDSLKQVINEFTAEPIPLLSNLVHAL